MKKPNSARETHTEWMKSPALERNPTHAPENVGEEINKVRMRLESDLLGGGLIGSCTAPRGDGRLSKDAAKPDIVVLP